MIATVAVTVLTLATACGRPASSRSSDPAKRTAVLRALGQQIFMDTSLSASGRIACATCHVPDRAFGPPDGRAVQLGGINGNAPGMRAVPTLRYLQRIRPFTRHALEPPEDDDDGEGPVDGGPAGGLTWDGRVDRARDQARLPLLSPYEMGNATIDDVSARILAAPYASDVRQFMAESREDATSVALDALQAFESTPELFAPYTSRFDDVTRGRAAFTPIERTGLVLFMNRDLGNCASCHPSEPDRDGTPPAFSDYGMVALGLPRNADIPANRDPRYVDLGLCGPSRIDLVNESQYCGRFRTPTLRNVATRQVFFHNGSVHTLRDAVAFYATRDSDPARWFPRGADGLTLLFDDLPARYRANVETGAPFGLVRGRARLSDSDVDAIVAFLETLTDADMRNVSAPPAGSARR